MTKRILSATMIVLLLCSCAPAATWKGFWHETKNFFGAGAERVKNWWNNSDSKKLDKITEDVTSLRGEVSSMHEEITSLAGNTPVSEREQAIASQEEHLRKERQQLQAVEAQLASHCANRHCIKRQNVLQCSHESRRKQNRKQPRFSQGSKQTSISAGS